MSATNSSFRPRERAERPKLLAVIMHSKIRDLGFRSGVRSRQPRRTSTQRSRRRTVSTGQLTSESMGALARGGQQRRINTQATMGTIGVLSVVSVIAFGCATDSPPDLPTAGSAADDQAEIDDIVRRHFGAVNAGDVQELNSTTCAAARRRHAAPPSCRPSYETSVPRTSRGFRACSSIPVDR